jgi:hypothetical protein
MVLLYYICCVSSRKKIIISSVFLAIAIFIATPKVYIHKLLGHDHSFEHSLKNQKASINNDKNQDCNLDKFETPVYFTIFKFIINWSPIKQRSEKIQFHKNVFFNSCSGITLSLLRAPPLV